MVSVIADKPVIERLLRRLVALSEDAGAEFSRDLVVKCTDGNLSIEAPPEQPGSVLLRLPWHCLVPILPFRIVIADDTFVIASHEPELTGACVAMMEALLELYNLTDKLAVHRRTSPWSLAASQPELLRHLLAGRRLPFANLIASGNRDELDLQSFFHSRVLGYTEAPEAPEFSVLMPVLDAMNHHWEGAGYALDDRDERGLALTMTRSRPLPGTGNECFARYGVNDCFDCWMSYGFVDDTPPYVRSLAMEIDLPGLGTIHVADVRATRAKEDLPPPVQDLSFHIPKLLARRRNQINTASVFVPGPQAPRALRRTLGFLIAELNPGRPLTRDLVLHAERQIIATNQAYYQALIAFLRSMPLKDAMQRPTLENFIRVCEFQLRRLRDYAGYAAG